MVLPLSKTVVVNPSSNLDIQILDKQYRTSAVSLSTSVYKMRSIKGDLMNTKSNVSASCCMRVRHAASNHAVSGTHVMLTAEHSVASKRNLTSELRKSC